MNFNIDKRDIRDRKKVTIVLDKLIWKEIKKISIDLNIFPSDYVEKVLEKILKESPK